VVSYCSIDTIRSYRKLTLLSDSLYHGVSVDAADVTAKV
jgi:hypothetical protein